MSTLTEMLAELEARRSRKSQPLLYDFEAEALIAAVRQIERLFADEVDGALEMVAEKLDEEGERRKRGNSEKFAISGAGINYAAHVIRSLIPADSALPALLAAEHRRGAEEALSRVGFRKSSYHPDLWQLDEEPPEEIRVDALIATAAEGGES